MSLKQRIIACLLAVLSVFALSACGTADKPEQQSDAPVTASQRAEAWIVEQIENNTLFSFEYNGKSFAEAVETFEKKSEETEDGWILTYTTPEKVVAWAEISYFEEYNTLDWCCYFRNDGNSDSPVISNIRAMDALIEMTAPVLTTAEGSDTDAEEFQPITHDFAVEQTFSYGSSGGRSSQGKFPYFDICDENGGIVGAIGWTGQWTANFKFENDKLAIDTGMAETSISLYAGEDMRTPSMVILFFDGDQDEGHNQLRQLIINVYSPRDDDGNVITQLPDFFNLWGGNGEESHLNNLALRDRLNVPYDGLWIDAGWSGEKGGPGSGDGSWTMENGNLYLNETLYPEGFSNIADILHEQDKELLLWFEPERAMPGTKLVTEYPQYYLPKSSTATFYLFDFGNDEACDFMIELIDGMIKEYELDWYRQDFNVEPYETWLYSDRQAGENRVGMTEIKYITNLYRYIDTLLERNPGLMMDNCSSGGKRLDIEMMSRSFPMWRTDYSLNGSCYGDDIRSINYNLTYWLPLHAGGAGAADGRTVDYTWRCAIAGGMTNGTLVPDDMSWYNTMYEQYLRCRELMAGDYYILNQGIGSEVSSKQAIYEFYDETKGEGYIMAFCPGGCRDAEGIYPLKGLDAEATYQLECVDNGQTFEASGADLMNNGFTVNMEPNTSLLVFITKK